jgi:hypothetical protein
MANPAREDLKQYLLLALVGVCVVLVGLIWLDNLDGSTGTNAAFVRGTAPAGATLVPPPTRAPDATHRHTQAAPTTAPVLAATPSPTSPTAATSLPPATVPTEPSGEE